MSKPATILEVMRYFGYETTAAFRKDWGQLSAEDQTALKEGIGSGSLTY